MKKNWKSGFAGLMMTLLIFATSVSYGQSERAVVKKYLEELPKIQLSNALQKYRMTGVYTNMDLYGNFTGKIKVTGDYTRGLPGDSVVWNNVYISNSNKADEPFNEGTKQKYMENFKYVPSSKMVLEEDSFKNFPSSPDNIYGRNLIWDMLTFEVFAWNYYDSLKLNDLYKAPDLNGQFDMAEIGKYSHNKVTLCWKGITELNGEIYAILDFNAIDNKMELSISQIKTKGTEQYWGTVLLSLKTKNIEHAVMYSGTIQEVEVTGMKDKFLVKTIRELEVSRIK